MDFQYSFTINSGKTGPKVLICAGVHGDEYEPMLAAKSLVKTLPNLLKNGVVTIVPVVNETAAANNQRCGTDGLDLARICPGNTEGSVSMQAAARISDLIKQADYLVDLHTGGRIFQIFPMAGYMLHPSVAVLEKQRDMAKAFNLPTIWGTDPAPNGRTLSVARDHNVPAIYVEYGGGNRAKSLIIKAFTEGCLNLLRHLKMINGKAKIKPMLYWVEDFKPNAGHLQVKMPAPTEGVFQSAVKLGQPIEKGELWGTITDLFSDTTASVLAEESGIVLFLRDVAYVKKGDSLGGVLNLENAK